MKLLLVDLSAIFWRNWHATKDQEIGSAFESTVAKALWLASAGYDGTAICCDAPPYFRKQLSPEYKAQRDTPEPAAVEQLRRVIERLTLDGFQVWKAQGFEADDVIASAVTWAVQEKHAVHIASADKDLMALVCELVQLRSTSTDDIYDVARVVEKFGVRPGQMTDYLALVGDKGDNVKGVAGVGPVKARDLIKTFGSLPGLLSAAKTDGLSALTPALQASLVAAANDGSMELAYELVALRNDIEGIDWSAAFKPREEKPLENSVVTDAEFTENTPAQEVPVAVESKPDQELPGVVQSVALATVQPAQASYSTALEPRSFGEAWTMAKIAVNARSFGVANNETALAMILRGRALGLDAVTSLSAFHVIKNKMTLTATMIEGMVMRAECCEYFMCTESTAERCTWVTKRKGYPKEQTHTWTIGDAEKLGLLNLDQWKKQPRTMLRHRCGTDLARMAFPDIIAGLYGVEEMEAA